MQKRKGFTLVELVIVIAVIAILAGVLIGTFASVINRANESARLQAVKAQEIEQKADDILKKIEDSNWYGWEDFETSIVAKLEKTFEQHSSSGATTEQIKATLVEALNEYAKNHVTDNTSLTEEQVKAIVENAVGTLKFEGVTEAQVRAIVNEATSRTAATQLSAAQVKAIVNAANENNVTAAQVAQIVAQKMSELDNKYSASETEIKNKIDSVVTSITSATLTEEQVAQIVENLLPVTVHVSSASELQTKAQTLNSFSTIFVDTAISDPVTISTTDTKTLIIKGAALNKVTINAPKATIYLVSDASQVIVQEIAQNSFHVAGTVQSLVVNAGRAVVESSGSVNTLTAAPALEKTVKVVIEETAIVSHLVAEYQKNGNGTNDWIEVENNGTVGEAKLVVVAGTDTNTDVTTNVKVTNGANASGTEIAKVTTEETTAVQVLIVDDNNNAGKLYNVVFDTTNETTQQIEQPDKYLYWIDQYASSFAGGDGSPENPYQISNGFEFARLAYLVNNNIENYKGLSYVLVDDVDLSGKCWTPISYFFRSDDTHDGELFAGKFDGQNYTINGLTDNGTRMYIDVTPGVNSSTPIKGEEYVYGLFGTVGTSTLQNIIFENVAIAGADGSDTYIFTVNNEEKHLLSDAVGALTGAFKGTVTVTNVHANTGSIYGYDEVGGLVGRFQSGNITFTNCSNGLAVSAVRRASGILCTTASRYYWDEVSITDGALKLTDVSGITIFNSCSNSGVITSLGKTKDYQPTGSGYYGASIITHISSGASSTQEKWNKQKDEISVFTNTGKTITVFDENYSREDTYYLVDAIVSTSGNITYDFDPTWYLPQSNTNYQNTTESNSWICKDENNYYRYTVTVNNGTWTVTKASSTESEYNT